MDEEGFEPFTTKVVPPRAEPRDEETRLEPAMGPRLFNDVFDAFSGGGDSAGSSDPKALLLLCSDGLPWDSGKLFASARSRSMSQNRPVK